MQVPTSAPEPGTESPDEVSGPAGSGPDGSGPPARDAASLLVGLERTGHRITEPRRAVAALVAGRSGHFTAADLVADAQAQRVPIGRATVFRALELFTSLGIVERLDLPSGLHAYVPCEPAHHHHVVCSRCGRTAEIDDGGLRALSNRVARRTGFRVDAHRLELFGLCRECARAKAP